MAHLEEYSPMVLGADIVSPAKPARRLSAHVSLFDKNKGDFSFLEQLTVFAACQHLPGGGGRAWSEGVGGKFLPFLKASQTHWSASNK